MPLETPIRDLIGEQRALWVLVNPEGTARVAIPFGMSLSDLYGEPGIPTWVDAAGSPLDRELECVLRFLERRPGWAALVSLLSERPEVEVEVRKLLPPERWRELDAAEYQQLREMEMDVPMGPWALQESARIFVVA